MDSRTVEPVIDGKTDRERLRAQSKLLLGSSHQAEVGAAIAKARKPVWGSELLRALELETSAKGMVSVELKRLESAGLVVRAAASEFDRRKPFEPVDASNPYWALCRQLWETPLK